MYPRCWLVVSFAVLCRLVAATSKDAMIISPASVPTISHIVRDQVQWPISLPAMPIPVLGQIGGPQQSLHLTYHYKRQTPQAAQQLRHEELPRATSVERAATDQDTLLKFLPKPGPLPSTTPHYATDLDAQRSAAIAANQARLQTNIQSDSNTTITVTSSPRDATTADRSRVASASAHWTTASMEQILAVILSLSNARTSVESKISSASMVSSVGVHQLDSIASALAQVEDHLYHRTHYGGDDTTTDTDAASLLSSSMAFAMSLTAAIGFAGLAIFL